APDARLAREADLAAEDPADLAADRETEAGAAELAAGAAVGLLEGLEDDQLLVARDADAGVADPEGDDGLRPRQGLVLGAPAVRGRHDLHVDPPALRELEGVRQEVLQHLLQALAVGEHGVRKLFGDADVELEPLRLRD